MKRIISAVCAAVFAVSLLSFGITPAGAAEFSDVDESSSYYDAISTLTTLGLLQGYENGSFQPEGNITRAEFATIMARILGMESMTYTESEFSDCSDHWAKNYIESAKNVGIIAGMGDGTFLPDSPVTYEQALKMLVCLLGYESDAVYMGGWPMGYRQKASDLKLTRNISGQAMDAPASRQIVAQIMYNALDVNIRENMTGGFSNITDETIMSKYLRTERITGIVTGVEENITELSGSRNLVRNQMEILEDGGEYIVLDFAEYSTDINEMTGYLGKTITAYYRENSDAIEGTLLSIDIAESDNKVYTVDGADISGYSAGQLRYYDENGKSATEKLDPTDMTVIYNGKLVDKSGTISIDGGSYTINEALEYWLEPSSPGFIYGYAELTDSGSTGTISMINITDYQLMVASKTPTVADYRITDKLVTGNGLTLNPSSVEYEYTINKNGKSIDSVTGISSGDVILYTESLDKELYSLYVTSNKITGTVEMVSGSGEEIQVNGKKYTVLDTFQKYIDDNSLSPLRIGENVTMNMDYLGNAVYGTPAAAEVIPYAYIVGSDYSIETETGYLSFYSKSNTGVKMYPLDEDVQVNSQKMSSEEAIAFLTQSAANGNGDAEMQEEIYGENKEITMNAVSQVARILVKNNVITEIATVSDTEYVENDSADSIVRYSDPKKLTYTSGSFKNGNSTEFYVNSSTTVLFVPRDRTDRTKFRIAAPSSMFTTGQSYYVEAFNLNSSKYASLVVYYSPATTISSLTYSSPFYSLIESPSTVSVDGDQYIELRAYDSAAAAEKTIRTEEQEFADLKPGDYFQYLNDSDGNATGLEVRMDMDDIMPVLEGATVQKPAEETGGSEDTESDETGEEGTSQTKDVIFDWTDSRFTFRYSNNYTAGVPYTRVMMANIVEIINDEESGVISVRFTQDGFDENGEIAGTSEEKADLNTNCTFLKYDPELNMVFDTIDGTDVEYSIENVKDVTNYGTECSKALLYLYQGRIRQMVLFN